MSNKADPLTTRQRSAGLGGMQMPATAQPQISPGLVEPQLQPIDGTSCAQHIRISIFFDGTGNNLTADKPDGGHSNVARLFRAHPMGSDAFSVYAVYVPGIGTYFKEIDDKGSASFLGGRLGLGVALHGQQRLDWTFQRVHELIANCDARTVRSPSARVEDIKLAVFGFSRGAAQARAFCRDLAKMCPGEQYLLPTSRRKVPIEVDFLTTTTKTSAPTRSPVPASRR